MNNTPSAWAFVEFHVLLLAAAQEATTNGSYQGSWSPYTDVDLDGDLHRSAIPT